MKASIKKGEREKADRGCTEKMQKERKGAGKYNVATENFKRKINKG